jgi:hypothetical protein
MPPDFFAVPALHNSCLMYHFNNVLIISWFRCLRLVRRWLANMAEHWGPSLDNDLDIKQTFSGLWTIGFTVTYSLIKTTVWRPVERRLMKEALCNLMDKCSSKSQSKKPFTVQRIDIFSSQQLKCDHSCGLWFVCQRFRPRTPSFLCNSRVLGSSTTEIRRHIGIGAGMAIRWTTGLRFPTGPRECSLLHSVKTGSGAHLASYPLGTGGYFSGNKTAGACSWPLTPSSAQVKNGGSILPLPHMSSWRVA